MAAVQRPNFSHQCIGLTKKISSPGFGDASTHPQTFAVTAPNRSTCSMEKDRRGESGGGAWQDTWLPPMILIVSAYFTVGSIVPQPPHATPRPLMLVSVSLSVMCSNAIPSLSVGINNAPTVFPTQTFTHWFGMERPFRPSTTRMRMS